MNGIGASLALAHMCTLDEFGKDCSILEVAKVESNDNAAYSEMLDYQQKKTFYFFLCSEPQISQGKFSNFPAWPVVSSDWQRSAQKTTMARVE